MESTSTIGQALKPPRRWSSLLMVLQLTIINGTHATGEGVPFAGRIVTLTLEAGLGSLSSPTVTLNANGVAVATPLALMPGIEMITATAFDHGLAKIDDDLESQS